MSLQFNWSPSEKRIARAAYDKALDVALAKVMSDFKQKAFEATVPAELWDIEGWLKAQRQQIDEVFDYRYSQLPMVFAALIARGYLDRDRLAGLDADKIEAVERYLT